MLYEEVEAVLQERPATLPVAGCDEHVAEDDVRPAAVGRLHRVE